MKLSLFFISAFMLAGVIPAGAETIQVTVKENSIRTDCRFYAPVKVKVRLGDRLTVAGKSGDWYRVSFKGATGCIHQGAAGSRTYAVTGSGGRGGTSAQEVSLAGKGFNPQVESAYKSKNPRLDFETVNSIERSTVDEAQLADFVEKGGLKLP